MMRWTLFAAILAGGSLIFPGLALLPIDEAWLVSGVIAAIVVFAIPDREKPRDRNNLIFMLIAIIGLYGIHFKLQLWLATVIDPKLAMVIGLLSTTVFIVALFVPTVTQVSKSQTPNR